MTIEQVLLLIGAGVLANFGIIAALLIPRPNGMKESDFGAERGALRPAPGFGARARPDGGADAPGEPPAPGTTSGGAPRQAAPDRIARVISLVFIATAGITVAVSGEFQDVKDLVYIVLTMATLAVVFVSDLLPARLRGLQRAFEVVLTILVVTGLVGLTGAAMSPFVAGYFLVVGASALSSDDFAPMLVAIASAVAYLLTAAFVPTAAPLGQEGIGLAIFNVVALMMLAYVATVIGREQRRARFDALRLARFDPLTTLYARSSIFRSIEQEIARAARIGRGFCMLMLDLDDLKPINDTFGHQSGDAVLKAVADIVRRTIRQTDLAGRFGGDEFLILLPETEPAGALILAEKLRHDVASAVMRAGAQTFHTTISLGLVTFPDDGTNLEQLMASVDAAMYESKRRGKNQIVGYVTKTERVPVAEADGPPGGDAPGGDAPGGDPPSGEPPPGSAVRPQRVPTGPGLSSAPVQVTRRTASRSFESPDG